MAPQVTCTKCKKILTDFDNHIMIRYIIIDNYPYCRECVSKISNKKV